MRATEFVFIDVETTGLDPVSGYICEICAQVFYKDAVTRQYCTFIKPLVDIPDQARGIHGISGEMIKSAPDFAGIADELLGIMAGKVLCGYNVSFDREFINQELKRSGKPLFTGPAIDLLKIARDLLPGLPRYNLGSVAGHCRFSTKDLHRAYPDVCLEIGLFKRFVEMLEKKNITTLAQVLERYSG
jgi:DNA polymerase III epsilon subunit family exonuclease